MSNKIYIRIEELQEACKKILTAVDTNTLSSITDMLELETDNQFFYLRVTNQEYYCQVKFPLVTEEQIDFHATVSANLFLKLISQITTESISFEMNSQSLIIHGNGTYKLPLLFENERMISLPRIEIKNVTNSFEIDSKILSSILFYNSKELTKGIASQLVQKMYYVDQEGAITFVDGACVNSFTLPQPIKILFNDRLVKLFKLFNEEAIQVSLGHDEIQNGLVQTKMSFVSKDVEVVSILPCDDALISSVPADAIRKRAKDDYPYCVSLNKNELGQAINRLLLFNSIQSLTQGKFDFKSSFVDVYDANNENHERIFYQNDSTNIEEEYSAIVDLNDLKSTLETCNESIISLSFGNAQAMILSRGSIVNVIPELNED